MDTQNFARPAIAKMLALALSLATPIAWAQAFEDLIFFGDSNTDNGRYRYVPQYTGGTTNATGVFTTPGGSMWSVYLGSRYGITVTSTAAPGGGNNYAAGNAHVAYAADHLIGENAWSTDQQITSYLSSVNGRADPNVLYTLYIGTNDLKSPAGGLFITPNIVDGLHLTELTTLAAQTTAQAQRLSAAGVRYLLVPNIASTTKTQAAATAASFPWTQTQANALAYYNQAVWNGIAAQGINFIPVDFASGGDYVLLNPARFGITVTSITAPACGAVAAIDCELDDLATLNAMNTHFFTDSVGHASSAVQKIQSDYVYALLSAPGQVSMLANQAALSQISMNATYLNKASSGFREAALGTWGAWALGGGQQIDLQGSTGTSSPYNGAVGADYQYSQNILLGGFAAYARTRINYEGGGNFKQSGNTLGAYFGYQDGGVWADGLAAYQWLNNQVNRYTPIGITSFENNTAVNGTNATLALQSGYDVDCGAVKHGPVLSYNYVRSHVDGFTESGNITSLQFGSQTLHSHVGSVGYRVQARIGDWSPFAKALYNSHLGDLNRTVTTTLTTDTAPSYTMPAIAYGRSWMNLTAGFAYQLDRTTAISASFTQEVAQRNVDNYNATLSLSSRF